MDHHCSLLRTQHKRQEHTRQSPQQGGNSMAWVLCGQAQQKVLFAVPVPCSNSISGIHCSHNSSCGPVPWQKQTWELCLDTGVGSWGTCHCHSTGNNPELHVGLPSLPHLQGHNSGSNCKGPQQQSTSPTQRWCLFQGSPTEAKNTWWSTAKTRTG